jgi:hypothetical protein
MLRLENSTCGMSSPNGVNLVTGSRPRSCNSSIALPRPFLGKARLENRKTVKLGVEVIISHPAPKAGMNVASAKYYRTRTL